MAGPYQHNSSTSSTSLSSSTVRSRPLMNKAALDNGHEQDIDTVTRSSTQKPNGIFTLKPPSQDHPQTTTNSASKSNSSPSSNSSTETDTSSSGAGSPTSTDPILGSPTSLEDRSTGQGPLCDWADLPHWMQDNPSIWTGYRRPTYSYRKCVATLGFFHNETVNIYSHLLGALVCIAASPFVYFNVLGVVDTIHWTDIVVFYIFIAGAVTCLSMSASFHCFSCHSEPVCSQWNRCDYVGIVFLIVGSFYPAIFYGFYCHQTLQIMYLTLITIFGGATIVAVIRPKFRTPQFRWVRSTLFIALGLCGVFPVIHGLFVYGTTLAQEAMALKYLIWMAVSYIFGAILYGSRTPERFFPGKLDYVGASHQIFHMMVLMGVLAHFLGVTKAMIFWHDANHMCNIPIAQMRAEFV
ncbi:hypothetical protein BGZ94_000004 [Podila epigama]|nr:hypothetical protein BGZ94_000004 [Podila epigama]